MIHVLDTDICVEYLKGDKDVIEKVLRASSSFVTSITVAELFYRYIIYNFS
jgi:predicted nucleic acid-binding protein